MTKFCKDCEHFVGDPRLTAMCERPTEEVDLVHGNSRRVHSPAHHERQDSDSCGPNAKYFTPRLTLVEKLIRWGHEIF